MIIKNTLCWLLVVIIFLALLRDWPEVSTAGGLGFIRNNLSWAVVVSLICLGLYYSVSSNKLKLPKYSWLLLLALLISIVPFFINLTPFYGYGRYLPVALSAALLCYLALFQINPIINNKQSILLAVIAIAYAEVLIGCWQLFHSLMMQLTSDVDQYKLIHIDGTFNQRNLFASFVSTGLLVSIFSMLTNIRLTQSIRIRNVLYVFLGLGSFILMMSDSRVGIYSFIVGALILFAFHTDNLRYVTKIIMPIFVGILVAITFSNVVYDGKTKDFGKTHNRQLIYSTSLEAIKQAPILGHGLGSFEKVYLDTLAHRVKSGELKKGDITRPENLSHPHNEFLFWGVQGGIVSVVGLLLLLLFLFSSTFKAGLKKNLVYYSLLCPISLHLMVELPFYISGVHLLLAILLLFYIVSCIGELKTYEINLSSAITKTGQLLISLCGIATITILLVNSYSLYQVAKFEAALNRTEKQLEKAIVTVGWEDAYQSLLLKHQANIAAKTGKKEPIIVFLRWLEKQNEISPRLQYFFNIYYSYQILGEQQKAEEIKRQIKYYYAGVKTAEDWLKSTDKGASD
ncbi:PglL family O-oligosaccharyltransferase [Kangiella geojedonensis]|uniref:Uncharacterized protein n=1 Tax=Kangiella geojedonensis TaxID=914150 RepID=A0A0F6RCQ7_9GAMM|nr:O-antigen ligase family protein [Kangiella geojedonensis]AKE52628.1 hypothetical protein TQ33_1686 [Kangiella geojedonensis]